MIERITEASPRLKARIAGGLWLMVIVVGMTAFVIRSPLIVRGDAATTATNIMASESLVRLGFAADLIAGVCYMGVTVHGSPLCLVEAGEQEPLLAGGERTTMEGAGRRLDNFLTMQASHMYILQCGEPPAGAMQ